MIPGVELRDQPLGTFRRGTGNPQEALQALGGYRWLPHVQPPLDGLSIERLVECAGDITLATGGAKFCERQPGFEALAAGGGSLDALLQQGDRLGGLAA